MSPRVPKGEKSRLLGAAMQEAVPPGDGAMAAARLWWMLSVTGRRVAVLDGDRFCGVLTPESLAFPLVHGPLGEDGIVGEEVDEGPDAGWKRARPSDINRMNVFAIARVEMLEHGHQPAFRNVRTNVEQGEPGQAAGDKQLVDARFAAQARAPSVTWACP